RILRSQFVCLDEKGQRSPSIALPKVKGGQSILGGEAAGNEPAQDIGAFQSRFPSAGRFVLARPLQERCFDSFREVRAEETEIERLRPSSEALQEKIFDVVEIPLSLPEEGPALRLFAKRTQKEFSVPGALTAMLQG